MHSKVQCERRQRFGADSTLEVVKENRPGNRPVRTKKVAWWHCDQVRRDEPAAQESRLSQNEFADREVTRSHQRRGRAASSYRCSFRVQSDRSWCRTGRSPGQQESPIEILVELVLTLIWEIGLQIVAEILIELGFGSAGDSVRQRSRAHPALAAVGIVLLGGLAGSLTSLIWPSLIFRPGPVPGISLLVSPLVSGLVMDRYGDWRERHGGERSYVATFWGGALFAFTMALVRFLWVGKAALDI